MSNRNFQFQLGLICALLMAAPAVGYTRDHAKDKKGMAKVDEELTTEISYEKGSPFLDASDRKMIDELVMKAKQRGEISEIKVLSWSDRDYPKEGAKAEKKDRDLASKRADRIKDYLKNTHKVGDVDTFNMAERPNALEELFSTEDYEVKTAAEQAGSAPTEKRIHALRPDGRSSTSFLVVQLQDKR